MYKLKNFNVGFIGYVLIGERRSQNLPKNCNFVCFYDPYYLKKHKKKNNSLKTFLEKDLDIVVVATPHKYLSYYALLCIKKKINVFIEKPGAINLKELNKINRESKKNKLNIAIGYNHRFHPGIEKALKLFKKKTIGDLMFIRALYGHGGRLGYEKEWRFKKKLSGGGELLDQGSHIIDLFHLFVKNFDLKYSKLQNFFWRSKNIEDNAFCIFASGKKILSMHVSWTEWKNKFNFEIFGKKGKIEIIGLGKSYGIETVNLYKMKKNMKKPKKIIFKFRKKDNSFYLDFENFVNSLIKKKPPMNNVLNAIKNMRMIEKIYQSQ